MSADRSAAEEAARRNFVQLLLSNVDGEWVDDDDDDDIDYQPAEEGEDDDEDEDEEDDGEDGFHGKIRSSIATRRGTC